MEECVPTTLCAYCNGHTYFFVNMAFNGHGLYVYKNLCGRHVKMKVVIVYQNNYEVEYVRFIF
jgi:hypothetical protein